MLNYLNNRRNQLASKIASLEEESKRQPGDIVVAVNLAEHQMRAFEIANLIELSKKHEEWAARLIAMLEETTYELSDFEDGYTDGEMEDFLPLLNRFVSEIGLGGTFKMVWEKYKEGFCTGGSEVYYHRPADLTHEIGVAISLPLPNNVEDFIWELIGIEKGVVEMEPFTPCYLEEYESNAVWNIVDHTIGEEEEGE